jgi:enoyl-CoA hydratase/carnithine racemase
MKLAKENMNRALVADLQAGLDAEAANMVRSMRSGDHEEAVAAFIEKRPPEFRGE